MFLRREVFPSPLSSPGRGRLSRDGGERGSGRDNRPGPQTWTMAIPASLIVFHRDPLLPPSFFYLLGGDLVFGFNLVERLSHSRGRGVLDKLRYIFDLSQQSLRLSCPIKWNVGSCKLVPVTSSKFFVWQEILSVECIVFTLWCGSDHEWRFIGENDWLLKVANKTWR